MDLLWLYALLRLLARSLRAGDPVSAGRQLDADLDGVTSWLGGLWEGACGCCIGYAIVLIVVGIVGVVVIVVRHWITGH
jgi:hypothetical protein